jgi:hypothetical protein
MSGHKHLILWMCFLVFAVSGLAQVETARITGTVTDATGAVIPGVQITMVHVQTNRKVAATTNEAGQYVSIPLSLGDYRVEAEAPGFKRVVRTGITLRVQQTAVVDLSLQVGEITQSVEVAAKAPLLATREAAAGQVIDNQRMVDMPLNGRDYIQLALLSSGTVQTLGGRFGGFSTGGQRTTQNNYLLDGVDNNNYQNASQGERAEAVKPPVDAIQEFKVFTNSFSAEYGRAAGGVVNAVLKSGSNQLHGTAFGFLRNELLDARNFFARGDQPKPPFKRSQFGFAMGGPIRRDKTFFFGDYEGTRIRESRTVNNTIPTAAMRSGDFSALSAAIYDPLTYDPATRTRRTFANNRIPDARIDPVARAAAAWYPTPQTSGLTNNFLYNPPQVQNIDKFDVRGDHLFSAKDNVYYRFSYQHDVRPPSPSLPAPAFGSGTQYASETTNEGRNMALVWNHVFSSKMVASTRLAWNRTYTLQLPAAKKNLNAEIGLRGVEQSQPGAASFAIAGYTALGIGGFLPMLADSQTRQLMSDATWVKGRHSVKLGVNVMWLQLYLNNVRTAPGQFTFNGAFTRDSQTLRGGDAFADFLLGLPAQTLYSTSIYMNARTPWYNFYAHDEWQLGRRLTLSGGLRYELRRSWIETRNFMSNFDVDTNPSNPQFRLGKDGSRFDRATMERPSANVAPRLGFSYQPRRNTVLRGGYGIYYGNAENPINGGPYNPPFLITVSLFADGITPLVVLRDGLPAGILTPKNAGTLGLSAFQVRPSLPYSQQWSFSIQRQLGQNWLWEIGYYGNVAHHLQKEYNWNYALPGPGDINARRFVQRALWPGTDTVVPIGRVQRDDFFGNSSFHSLQTKIQKELSQGFTLLGSYMWSKTMGDSCGLSAAGQTAGCGFQNPLNHALERALDNQHVAHRFVASPIWNLPFGKKGPVSGWGHVANAVVQGWSVAGILTLTSGLPASLTVNGDPANTGELNRPDVVGNPLLGSGERTVDRWFNTAAFVANRPYTFGNAGRNILFRPGTTNVDFATYRRFRITESKNVQFRFEAFNLSNTPPLAPPVTALGDRNFGRITSAGRPRNIQMGLKFVF